MPEKTVCLRRCDPYCDGGTTRPLRHGGYCLNPQSQSTALARRSLCVICVGLLPSVQFVNSQVSAVLAGADTDFGKAGGVVGHGQPFDGGPLHGLHRRFAGF